MWRVKNKLTFWHFVLIYSLLTRKITPQTYKVFSHQSPYLQLDSFVLWIYCLFPFVSLYCVCFTVIKKTRHLSWFSWIYYDSPSKIWIKLPWFCVSLFDFHFFNLPVISLSLLPFSAVKFLFFLTYPKGLCFHFLRKLQIWCFSL